MSDAATVLTPHDGELGRLLDVPSDGTPWAELWLGTHPGAPATVRHLVPAGKPAASRACPT